MLGLLSGRAGELSRNRPERLSAFIVIESLTNRIGLAGTRAEAMQ
jgi:hypothetical protein